MLNKRNRQNLPSLRRTNFLSYKIEKIYSILQATFIQENIDCTEEITDESNHIGKEFLDKFIKQKGLTEEQKRKLIETVEIEREKISNSVRYELLSLRENVIENITTLKNMPISYCPLEYLEKRYFKNKLSVNKKQSGHYDKLNMYPYQSENILSANFSDIINPHSLILPQSKNIEKGIDAKQIEHRTKIKYEITREDIRKLNNTLKKRSLMLEKAKSLAGKIKKYQNVLSDNLITVQRTNSFLTKELDKVKFNSKNLILTQSKLLNTTSRNLLAHNGLANSIKLIWLIFQDSALKFKQFKENINNDKTIDDNLIEKFDRYNPINKSSYFEFLAQQELQTEENANTKYYRKFIELNKNIIQNYREVVEQLFSFASDNSKLKKELEEEKGKKGLLRFNIENEIFKNEINYFYSLSIYHCSQYPVDDLANIENLFSLFGEVSLLIQFAITCSENNKDKLYDYLAKIKTSIVLEKLFSEYGALLSFNDIKTIFQQLEKAESLEFPKLFSRFILDYMDIIEKLCSLKICQKSEYLTMKKLFLNLQEIFNIRNFDKLILAYKEVLLMVYVKQSDNKYIDKKNLFHEEVITSVFNYLRDKLIRIDGIYSHIKHIIDELLPKENIIIKSLEMIQEQKIMSKNEERFTVDLINSFRYINFLLNNFSILLASNKIKPNDTDNSEHCKMINFIRKADEIDKYMMNYLEELLQVKEEEEEKICISTDIETVAFKLKRKLQSAGEFDHNNKNRTIQLIKQLDCFYKNSVIEKNTNLSNIGNEQDFIISFN